ncbi:MAG: hypothetical protein HYX21_00540 [Candidatus Yanofskybacteria bacterium]|nr:hypothetical protein [Candidatus Yanofskybacteria bacterium]
MRSKIIIALLLVGVSFLVMLNLPEILEQISFNFNLGKAEDLEIVGTVQDLGKWVDARQQGSYYANYNSLIRDDSGRMHLTYCSSGELFNPLYAPDWRPTTTYATDKVRYQYSDDNGKTWSGAQIIIQPFRENNKDNLYQGACTSSLIYYKGFYYLYFESSSPPSGILAVHVARSSNPAGPYEVLTYDGWKQIPTNSIWKPVLNPAIRSVPGAEEWLRTHENNGVWSNYWGAGIPRVTQKDGKLYLFFVDTTNWIIWADSSGIHEYGRAPKDMIPYTLVAVSEDPTRFENIYDNRLVNASGNEIWNTINPKYFPDENKFYNFYLKNVDGQNKIAYRTSVNGIVWSAEIAKTDAISGNLNPNEGDPSQADNIIQLFHHLVLLSDKEGKGKLSDLYMTYQKDHLFDNGPVGWQDTPDYKWYYGGVDIYGLKMNLQVSSTSILIVTTTLSPPTTTTITTTVAPTTITTAVPTTATILSTTTTTTIVPTTTTTLISTTITTQTPSTTITTKSPTTTITTILPVSPTLIRASGDTKVYKIISNKKLWIPTAESFVSQGLKWQDIQNSSKMLVTSYVRLKLARAVGDVKRYYLTESGLKRYIPNDEVFLSYGNRNEDIVEITQQELNSYPNNDLIKTEGDEKVYKLENGQKRWIKTAGAFNRLGFDWSKIAPVNQTEINSYLTGSVIE